MEILTACFSKPCIVILDLCRFFPFLSALPEVVHEMKDIVGQLQLFAKTLQNTCHQLNQTCQRIPQREPLNRRMVTQATNRMPPRQKLVKKIGPSQPPIRTVKTVESLNSSPMRKVTQNSNQHFTGGSPTVSASSPRYSPSAKQSPGPFSPSQPGTPHSGSSPRPPRYPPSTSNPTLPVTGADNLPLVVSNVTSLSKNHFEPHTSQAAVPVPVQINSSKPADNQQQDVFELKPGTGVCIPIQGWISTKMQCGTSESKMVRQLMKFLFTEDDLANCSMRGNRSGQPCLDQNKVDSIICEYEAIFCNTEFSVPCVIFYCKAVFSA